MPQYVEVPGERLAPELLTALLEEYATRDGTDYGEREQRLEEKVASLQGQLARGEIRLLYDSEAEVWDLVSAQEAAVLLDS